jgi:tetratricopeptide (TPR) repeat protein
MKIKHIVLASTILVSVATFAQKDELKALKKIYGKEGIKANDLVEYKNLIAKAEPLATEESDKVYLSFYKGVTPLMELKTVDQTNLAQVQEVLGKALSVKSISDFVSGLTATLDYEKKSGKKVYTDDILTIISVYKPQIVEFAGVLGAANKNKDASDIAHSIYLLDKKDQDMLYYAASYAVNANEYDKALEYYEELKKLNYTGAGTIYLAYNIAQKKEENFGVSKNLRDIAVTSGSHSKPREEKIPSKKGEIYKNIALILVEKGKITEAKAAVAEARLANPDETSLILTEADLYLKENDMNNYTRLVNEALAKEPNNVDLIYNLGVISSNGNKFDEAEKYYKRALEINPNYFNANLNLAELKLRGDEALVKEMNKLGTSEKDTKRYEVLKKQRDDLFRSVLPYLEKAVEVDGTNEPAKKTLISVYGALEMTDKAKALKAKL